MKSSSEDADDTWGCLYRYRKGKLEKKLKFDGYVKKYYYHLSTDVIRSFRQYAYCKAEQYDEPAW